MVESVRVMSVQNGGSNCLWLMNKQKHLNSFMSTHANHLNATNSYNATSIMKREERDPIKIEVISREDIKPSSPTPQNLKYFKLSMFDQIQAPLHYSFTFFYQNDTLNNNYNNIEQIIRDRSSHLKQSLSKILTRFYPFAGKVVSEHLIDCNDDGVHFIETRIDDELKNVLKKPEYKFLQRLIPDVDCVPNQASFASYVTMVQVHFFNCGGCAVTGQHNHKLVDGCTYMTFMKAWAAISRRDSEYNQIYPSFVSSKMFPQTYHLSNFSFFPVWCYAMSPAYLNHGKCSTKRFVFDALALKVLKAKASKNEPVSRIVAVLALLWKCITIATKSKSSILHVPVNIRQRCAPPIPESSVGNTLLDIFTRFDPNKNDLEIASMADELKKVITNVTSDSIEELKGENGQVKFLENVRNSMETVTNFGDKHYLSTSMCNFGSKEVDFGWGKPIWSCTGILNEDMPIFVNKIIMMDSCSGDGIEVWISLEEQVMDAVMCNPELLSFASVDPSVI